jgi:hypothetical protein
LLALDEAVAQEDDVFPVPEFERGGGGEHSGEQGEEEREKFHGGLGRGMIASRLLETSAIRLKFHAFRLEEL